MSESILKDENGKPIKIKEEIKKIVIVSKYTLNDFIRDFLLY